MSRVQYIDNPCWHILRVVALLGVMATVAAISLTTLHVVSASAAGNGLSAGQRLSAGQYLRASNGQFTVYMQTDGNLVIYTSAGKPIWGSGTNGTGSNNYLVMQTDGNLVVYTSAGKPVWASNTVGTGGDNTLYMQDDGNLVVYTSANKPVWASGTVYESKVPTPTPETLCTDTSALCQTIEGSVQGVVHMVCWQDAIWTDHQWHRWFYIQAPGGSEGFVHAGAIPITSQITTPNCNTVSWINAAAWALGQDGQTKVPANARNGNNVTYWSSWCWLFSYDAWKLGASHTPIYSASTAQQVWNLYSSHGRAHAPSNMPPRGSLIFFSYGKAGHVAVSLGNGWIETTQGSVESQRLPVTHKTLSQEKLTQLGYVPANQV